MKEIENRIFVEDEIFRNEFEYYFGNKRYTKCYVSYYHVKKDRESCHISGLYRDCLSYARYRRNDNRYKNYEFIIYIEK